MPSHSTIPDWSPTVQVNIKHLIDDVQCYQTVRELRWLEGVACPSCESQHVIKRGWSCTSSLRINTPGSPRHGIHEGPLLHATVVSPLPAVERSCRRQKEEVW